MDQSRETLQDRIKRIQDRNQQELLRDIVDSAWSWKGKDSAVATTDRWITVGGQTVRGTTAQEKAPDTTGGQTDAQGQTTGAKGDKGDSGPAGPAGKDGKDGKDGIKGEDGAPGAPGTTLHAELTDLLGPGPEYTHLNAAQTLALTGGGDTNLHWHSADRDRATHTGTQLAVTISDFSTASDARITAQKGVSNGLATLDSNIKIPLAQIPDAMIGQVKFQSLWNQTTNSPALPATPAAGTKGYYWICTDASQATYQGLVLNTGDWLIVNGNEGSLSWGKVDNTDSVTSVFGRTGPVTAQATDYNAFYQPLDSDLTAIAALTTTTFGRSLLTVADAAAARTAIGAQAAGSYQASSSVLTSIAAQSTGTGLLKLTAGVASLDSSVYALASSVPVASSTTPASLGTAAVGTGTTWARADHVHAMPTAAQVGAVPTSRQVIAGSGLSGGGALSGDVTLSLPSLLTAGSAGGGASVPVLTWDAYGRITGVSTAAITPAGIGAATAASLANYLPLAGGTVTGKIRLSGWSSGLSISGTDADIIGIYDAWDSNSIWINAYDSGSGPTSRRSIVRLFGTLQTYSRPIFNGYTPWDSGNLTGDQSAHYHSSDRAWGNITDVPAGVRAPWEYFQPLEDQRLRTTDSPSFSNITATGLAKVAALELSYGGSSTGTPRVTYDGMNLSFYFNDAGTVPLYIDKSTLQTVAYKLNALNVVSDLTPYTGYLNVGVPSNPWNGVFSKKICLSAEVFSSNVDAQKSVNNSYFEMLPSSHVTEVAIMPDSSKDYPAGTLLVIKGRNTGAEMLTQIKDVYRNIKAKDGSVLALANALYGLVGTKMFVRTNSLEWQEI